MGFAFKIDVITVDAGQLVVALLKELGRDLREHGVREHVLLLHDILAGFRLQLLDLRLQQICRTAGDGLLVAEDLLCELGADGSRRLAVVAVNKAFELLRYHLVTLAQNDVEHRLGADDLARRGNERRIAGVLAHAGNLLQHGVELVLLARVLQLLEQVGQ